MNYVLAAIIGAIGRRDTMILEESGVRGGDLR